MTGSSSKRLFDFAASNLVAMAKDLGKYVLPWFTCGNFCSRNICHFTTFYNFDKNLYTQKCSRYYLLAKVNPFKVYFKKFVCNTLNWC